MKIGFSNEKYVELQSKAIKDRIAKFGGKLYLEFGGKLFDDLHAARVLPGFDANVKTKLLLNLKEQAEIVFCICANDIERNKIRADFGINYGSDVLRLIDNLRGLGLLINSVVITQYSGQPAADVFKQKLRMRGEKVYIHTKTKGYPTDVNTIVSDEGYGKNQYIETTRPLVVITAPGPGSGKLATCLCQLYHESKRGVKAGYAKFETFPIWNLPLKHPVNLAYEAATADLKDVNMLDYFHLEAYGKTTVNYNRDLEVFPVVKTILERISDDLKYQSPTDMGVNMCGFGITDDEVCCEAARQEIIRRYYRACVDYKTGIGTKDSIEKIELLLGESNLSITDRNVVAPALAKSKKSKEPSMAIELHDGTIVTGRNNSIMTAPASAVLNAVKVLCGINDKIDLIAPAVLEPIVELKTAILGYKSHLCDLQEILIALSISAATNPTAKAALDTLTQLADAEAHSSHIISESDDSVIKHLKINLTSEAEFSTKYLFND